MIAKLRELVAGRGTTDAPVSPEQVRVLKFHYGNPQFSRRAYFLTFVPGHAQPTHMAKVSWHEDNRRRFRTEIERLGTLHERSAALAASVPRAVALVEEGARTLAVQSFMAGESLWDLATRRGRAEGLRPIYDAAMDWLASYQDAAPATGTTDGARLLDLAGRRLASARECFADAAARMGELVERARGRLAGLADVSLREQHGDFGPTNLLVDGGRVRVIDWEDAPDEHPWPGRDALNFLDRALLGLRRAHGTPPSWHGPWRAAHEEALRSRLGISGARLESLNDLIRLYDLTLFVERYGASHAATGEQLRLLLGSSD